MVTMVTIGTPEHQQHHQHLPFLRDITSNWRRRTVRKTEGQGDRNSGIELQSPMTATAEALAESSVGLNPDDEVQEEVELKRGNLTKSSQHRWKDGARPGPKQKRKFRLTSEALEYFQPFSHVSQLALPSCF